MSRPSDRQEIIEQIADFETEVEMRVLNNYIEGLAWAESKAERGHIRLAIRRETTKALRSLPNF